MIPSDHFTRFYNEVFKFLEQQGGSALDDYFLEISRNQEKHILQLIEEQGFAGMYRYWSVIRDEENCELDLGYDEEKFELRMHLCPSLTKAMDNDAEPFGRYCDHCAGWIGPIMDKTGYHLVYDVIDRSKPQCVLRVFKDRDKARAAEKDAALPMGWPGRKDD
jgi:hypothetical protein